MNLPFASGGPLGSPMMGVGANGLIRVLLIDDDKDEASLTRSLLARVEDIRYELDWVPTFLEGLASIARGEHDAYLIDHQLGGRTGIDLVREARKAGSLAALIMLTGFRDRATDLEAMDAGATDFLLKGKTDAALLDRTLRYAISHVALVSTLERSRNQMAGLEEIGRILVDDGPTPATVERVVELIVDRFGLPQIAIYLVDGDKLYPAGQRGYRRPLPSLSRVDAGVERVARARQPVFVPSFSSDTAGGNDPGATGTELSVPLMVAGELMGLLNVASSVADPIGEQDFAAIRVVADRLTVALAVTRERRLMEERVRRARHEASDGEKSTGQPALIDGETPVYCRAMLEPLLEVAIASAGPEPRAPPADLRSGRPRLDDASGRSGEDHPGRAAARAILQVGTRRVGPGDRRRVCPVPGGRSRHKRPRCRIGRALRLRGPGGRLERRRADHRRPGGAGVRPAPRARIGGRLACAPKALMTPTDRPVELRRGIGNELEGHSLAGCLQSKRARGCSSSKATRETPGC